MLDNANTRARARAHLFFMVILFETYARVRVRGELACSLSDQTFGHAAKPF